LVIFIYLVLIISKLCEQLHAQRNRLPVDGLVTGLECQMLTLKFSGQYLNDLNVVNAANMPHMGEKPGRQGFYRLRSAS
jgi:hypothetical protein